MVSIAGVGGGAERLYKHQLARIQRVAAEARIPFRPAGRRWGVALPLKTIDAVQAGSLRYRYRGMPMLKNPFDMALYPLVFWRSRPRTVIEIGSYKGVSAVWLADLIASVGERGEVVSVDVEAPEPPEHRDNVRYLCGDATRLGDVLTPELLEALPRPWLVVEDSAHTYEAASAVLQFFAPMMRPGEYLVIEDGVLSDMGWARRYGGGPGLAISRFLEANPDFEIDAEICDLFGHNVTFNPNGYLRRR